MPVLPGSGGLGSESVCAALTGGSLSCLPPERTMHSPDSFTVQALLYTALPLHPSGPNLACLPCLVLIDSSATGDKPASLPGTGKSSKLRSLLTALPSASCTPLLNTLMHTSTCTHKHMQWPYACLHTSMCTHTPKVCSSLSVPYSLKLPACAHRLLLNLPGSLPSNLCPAL